MMRWIRDLVSSVRAPAQEQAVRIDAKLAAGSDDARRAPSDDLRRRTLAVLRSIPPAREPALGATRWRFRLALSACAVLLGSAVAVSLVLGPDHTPTPPITVNTVLIIVLLPPQPPRGARCACPTVRATHASPPLSPFT